MEDIVTRSHFIARKELLNAARTIGSFQVENREKLPGLRGRACGMTALSGVCVGAFPFRGCRAAAVWGGATVDRQTGDRWEGTGVPARPGNGSGIRSRKRAETLRLEQTSCLSVASVASSAGRRRAAGPAAQRTASSFLHRTPNCPFTTKPLLGFALQQDTEIF